MSLDNLNDLLTEQLQDIYYAEKQLVKALPKMIPAALAASGGELDEDEDEVEEQAVATKGRKNPARK